MKKFMAYILAFIVGIFPGFFIVFNSVFTDSSGALFERGVTFLLVIVSYGIIGAIFGYFGRESYGKLALILSLPAILILLLYSTKEVSLIPLNLIYIALTLVSSYGGAFLAAKIRGNKEKL